MKITKNNVEKLKIGTIIEHNGCCIIELTSDYHSGDNWNYSYNVLEFVNEDNYIIINNGTLLKQDLIGDYVC